MPTAPTRTEASPAVHGVWLFVGSESLLLGAALVALAVLRVEHAGAFARGAGTLSLPLGATNTAMLLLSSMAMVWSVRACERGAIRRGRWAALATAGLGLVFLGIKLLEYRHSIEAGHLPGPGFRFGADDAAPVELFFVCYFTFTALHALHLLVGIGLVGWAAWRAEHQRMHCVGIYWHAVDVVWIYLFPLLYVYRAEGVS